MDRIQVGIEESRPLLDKCGNACSEQSAECADGNDTMIFFNRIGGNFGIGAFTLGSLFGLLYEDAENVLSFSVTGGFQLMASISNSFQRTTPRVETFIATGRSGWMKIYNQTGTIGIRDCAINKNANVGEFNGGYDLNHLTLTTASYVVPVFTPSCQCLTR
ncbi:MAG: hypothetical protein AB7I31_05875 [Blastocatellales bacterium]